MSFLSSVHGINQFMKGWEILKETAPLSKSYWKGSGFQCILKNQYAKLGGGFNLESFFQAKFQVANIIEPPSLLFMHNHPWDQDT
jgi:hypothetical protein